MEAIFVSHSKRDVEYCDVFDRAVARVGIRAFRSEFETITPPAWIVNFISHRTINMTGNSWLLKNKRLRDPKMCDCTMCVQYHSNRKREAKRKRTPMKSSKSNNKISVATIFYFDVSCYNI